MNKFSLCIIGLIFFIIPGCSSVFDITTEEEFTILVPQWPPEDSQKSQYPELSKWKVTISSSQESYSFYTTAPSFTYNFKKNLPCAITVQPITLLDNGEECEYFLPAGIIYPYAQIDSQNISATWEQGFLAHTINRIINSKKETGVSQQHLEKFLKEFNWQKAQQTINAKIEKSILEETAYFNPWQIDSERLLDNLCYGNFKTTFLNTTGLYTFSLSSLFQNDDFFPLSPFIPENQFLMEKNLIGLKKNSVNFLSNGKDIGVILICKSAKNVSKDFIQMPIYIEEI